MTKDRNSFATVAGRWKEHADAAQITKLPRHAQALGLLAALEAECRAVASLAAALLSQPTS